MLEFESVGKSFGPAVALHNVSCRVESGRFVTLFGPNGAGKTTLIRIAATLARPSNGRTRLFGQDVRTADAGLRRRIGVVSHQSFLYGELTALENLVFFARLFDRNDAEARARAAAQTVGLSDRLDQQVRSFSRGLEQRCAIARALVHDPDVLMLDEPYSGLDPVATKNLTSVLSRAHGAGKTVIMTSHDLARGAELAQDVGILARGRLRFWGNPPADIETAFAEAIGGSA